MKLLVNLIIFIFIVFIPCQTLAKCVELCSPSFWKKTSEIKFKPNHLLPKNLNDFDNYGYTPLHYAASLGTPEIINLFVNLGANVNQDSAERLPDSKRGETPLHTAARYGNPQNIEALIKVGANIEAKNDNGYTPFLLALSWGKPENVKVLLKRGANKFVLNSRNETALHLASRSIHCSITCDLLIKKGFSIKSEDIEGNRPLHNALKFGLAGTAGIKVLLDAGAKINEQKKLGKAPFHLALSRIVVDYKQIELLLAAGANINIKDNQGKTPLDIAKIYNSKGYLKFHKALTKTIKDLKKSKNYLY